MLFLLHTRNPETTLFPHIARTQEGTHNALFGYFDAGDVGGIEILSSKSHRNQDDNGLPGLRRRPFTQVLHILQID